MDLEGKVAIVTGASAGIGAATVKALHNIGMKVVGFARRKEKIQQLIEHPACRLFALKVDVTNQKEIIDGFAWVTKNVGPIDVLVNNAGVAAFGECCSISDGEIDAWKKLIDTNFTSIMLCCREAIKNMKENDIDGYIINISSIAGLRPVDFANTAVYSTSKYAVRGLTENLRLELARMNSKIRITCLSPGIVRTDIMVATGMTREEADEVMYTSNPYLLSEDIADVIKYLVQTPKHVQVSTLTVQPVGERVY